MSITLLLQLIISLLCLKEASAAPSLAKQGCVAHCGNVSIPYPFGIGKDCYFNDYFSINCNDSSTPPKPFLNHSKLNLELLNVSLEYKTVMVNSPITPLCGGNGRWRSTDVGGRPFRFSRVHNIFMVVGCDTNAVLITDDQEEILAGCTSNCNSGITSTGTGCYGIQCCQTTIPYSNQSTHLVGNCSYAFLSVRDWFANNISNPAISTNSGFAPLVMFWEMETGSLGRCYSLNLDWQSETAIDSCSCERRYEGNPFLPNGCQVVEACANCSILDCGMIGAEYQCFPSNRMAKELKAMILGLSIGGGSLLLLVGSFGLYKGVKKKRELIRKQKFFKRNGGLLLQQQLSSIETIEKTKIFTSKELEMATDNFNKSRILGQGGQGTVYKGMLNDGRIVAVKRSKIIDESQLEQFINEIMILSQINHRNILGLLGCCLETEVPLLVYEFISNGTLFQLIHDQNNEFPFSWHMRLQIASEVAGALAYLHSSSSMPIYHRDIKSTNILIDEKYRAKVSDFGTSRSISIEQTHLTTHVKGTFGYFDPEYFQSGRFTEKSDVYSFGVVLVELLTGKKPVSWTSLEEEKSLVARFILSLEKESHLYDILDDRITKEGEKEKIIAVANLAKRCLNLNGKKRPTMKEVTFELECIRMSSLPINSQQDILNEDEYGIVERMRPLDSAITSISIASNLSYRK
ncbi:hypothetical protein PVL29_022223 [Vitis rotundifolia]|uniref:Protein kinase domain-containing protein n=1 Tax=Vitis rotundifolia TaxID=103349 RepID=A0AA38YUU7_VITRO|nr:hypothetical protein PVL29_022223 [Vitis rotundifolia]